MHKRRSYLKHVIHNLKIPIELKRNKSKVKWNKSQKRKVGPGVAIWFHPTGGGGDGGSCTVVVVVLVGIQWRGVRNHNNIILHLFFFHIQLLLEKFHSFSYPNTLLQQHTHAIFILCNNKSVCVCTLKKLEALQNKKEMLSFSFFFQRRLHL